MAYAIVSTFRAGYEHGMYHPSSYCQMSYIPSSGWGGSMVRYDMVSTTQALVVKCRTYHHQGGAEVAFPREHLQP